jgi:hypothetical protein
MEIPRKQRGEWEAEGSITVSQMALVTDWQFQQQDMRTHSSNIKHSREIS